MQMNIVSADLTTALALGWTLFGSLSLEHKLVSLLKTAHPKLMGPTSSSDLVTLVACAAMESVQLRLFDRQLCAGTGLADKT